MSIVCAHTFPFTLMMIMMLMMHMTNRVTFIFIVHASLSIDTRVIEWKKEVEDRNNK